LRESSGFRWRIALLLVVCGALAYMFASIPATSGISVIWRSALAVLVTWPVYVVALYFWARVEGRRLNMAGQWPSLLARDQRGEMEDREASEKVDSAVNKVWEASRYQTQRDLLGFLCRVIATAGTWLIWDLLRMGPALMAEIILDGVVVPIFPEIQDRMPCEPWYKTAFLSTLVHFLAAAVCTVVLVTVWRYSRLAQ
jgi:hypothetical protein